MTIDEQLAQNQKLIDETEESIRSIEDMKMVVREKGQPEGDAKDALPALKTKLKTLADVRGRLLEKQASPPTHRV